MGGLRISSGFAAAGPLRFGTTPEMHLPAEGRSRRGDRQHPTLLLGRAAFSCNPDAFSPRWACCIQWE